jgi:hypothetical protein
MPPRTEVCRPIDRPDFYALVVYPAITYTFGGLSIDGAARVLDADGSPISGLLAAGGDAGDVFGLGYAGGLAQAMSLGIIAASTAGCSSHLRSMRGENHKGIASDVLAANEVDDRAELVRRRRLT